MGFEHIIGNDHIKHRLMLYIQQGVIPPTLIFSGPEGTNRRKMALAFSQILNCREPGGDPQHTCSRCRDIEKGIFPDVRMIEPDGQFLRKSQIDELIELSFLRPVLAEKKIMILKDAHRMNENAANAFLKTLEEPTPSNIFILLTSNLSLILPTIRSRCQILQFFPLSHTQIREDLMRKGFTEDTARLIAYFPRFYTEDFSPKDWKDLEEKRSRSFAVFCALITQTDVEDVLLDMYDRSRNRERFIEYFRELVNLLSVFLRDIMILAIDAESPHVANYDYRQKMAELIRYTSSDEVLFLLRKMEYLLRDVQRNLNSKVLILELIRSFSQGERNDV